MDSPFLKRFGRVFALPALLVLSVPLVAAQQGYTGISPLNNVVGLISQMFNITILHDPYVQLGFLRFCLFVLFMAVAFWVFGKLKTKSGTMFDRKTAGVISAVFAAISAFMMPENWLTANGGIITAVFSGLIPIGIVVGGIYLAVKPMNNSFIMRLLAVMLLFMLLGILDIYHAAIGLPLILFIPVETIRQKLKKEER